MTTLWTIMSASFKSEAVSYSLLFQTFYPNSVDYDTIETVICSSKFLYNSERQRNLQHFIEIEELPLQYGVVDLPSGQARSCLFSVFSSFNIYSGHYAACGFQVRLNRKQMQYQIQVI